MQCGDDVRKKRGFAKGWGKCGATRPRLGGSFFQKKKTRNEAKGKKKIGDRMQSKIGKRTTPL